MRKLVLAAIAAAGFTTMGPVLFGFALYGTAMAQAPIIIKLVQPRGVARRPQGQGRHSL
jgi:hypothetical protein